MLMRILSSIVRVFRPLMYVFGSTFRYSWYVATKTIGHRAPEFLTLAFQYSSKESFGAQLIATMLDHNLEYIAILVNGPPQLVLLACD